MLNPTILAVCVALLCLGTAAIWWLLDMTLRQRLTARTEATLALGPEHYGGHLPMRRALLALGEHYRNQRLALATFSTLLMFIWAGSMLTARVTAYLLTGF